MRAFPSQLSWRGSAGLALWLAAGVAQAHPGHGETGFAQAISHPFGGADHLLAMLAVGLWSAAVLPAGRRLDGPAVFLLMLGAGLVGSWSGIAMPGVEAGVALSVVLLGGMLLVGRRLHAAPGLALVGVAAFLHGTAHGVDLAGSAVPAWTACGVLLGSAALHALGLLAGRRLQALPAWGSRLVAAVVGGAGLAMLAVRL